jgi:hypothetical protein
MVKGGKYLWPWPPFIREGEREDRGGSLESATDTGVEPESTASGAHRFPLSRVTDRWAAVGILKLARVRFA